MLISKLFLEFMVFSFLGWIYECAYCTVSDKRWDNRGFLFGPVCPIYGVGAIVSLSLFYRVPILYGIKSEYIGILYIFLICMFGSAIMEYLTSYVLEKLFHAVWWDYSNAPLNINGRICLPASLGFGFAGVILVRYVFPTVLSLEVYLDRFPLLVEFLSLILMAVFAGDFVLTVQSLTDLLSKVENMENEFNTRVEGTVERVGDTVGNAATRMSITAERAREFASRLNYRERYLLRNARFKRPGTQNIVARIKEFTPGNVFRKISAETEEQRNIKKTDTKGAKDGK